MQRGYPAEQQRTTRTSIIRCDIFYFITRPAIFKIVQVISSLISFICLQNLSLTGCGGCMEWFRTAAMSGLLLSCIFLFVYTLHIVEKYDNIPWLKIDCICCIIWMIFNLSAAVRLATGLHSCREYGDCGSISGFTSSTAASIAFGFVTTIAYGCDAGLKLFWIIKGIPAQG